MKTVEVRFDDSAYKEYIELQKTEKTTKKSKFLKGGDKLYPSYS